MKEVNRTYLKVDSSHSPFFSALASETRLKIIELIQNKSLSIQDISSELGLSSAVITKHVNILEKADIIRSYSEKGIRGRLKMCQLNAYEVMLIFNNNYEAPNERMVEKSIPIGSYHDFHVSEPCGMASKQSLIGHIDNPDVFYYPEREKIQLIWFTSGHIAYFIPTYDIALDDLASLEISFEICAEYPGYNNRFKSDIAFSLNGIDLVTWTAPGDYGGRKGNYTPSWWELGTEYGELITLKVSDEGTFLNGLKVSGCTLEEVLAVQKNALDFQITAPADTPNSGGLNLFGEHFGDYAQHIKVKYFY
ncbi:ArsR/SmtB family transcription factor [Atopococcus tabaci]|uniref:ArsR/SmtB family transcription factor n=1 Tax=Atopococcus tabaci TaxID=269774 RepID=UPI0003F87C4E|nr:ArsR family transcriptional regulator [Atopococcus tabaci]